MRPLVRLAAVAERAAERARVKQRNIARSAAKVISK
jgi:hypothetical protein